MNTKKRIFLAWPKSAHGDARDATINELESFGFRVIDPESFHPKSRNGGEDKDGKRDKDFAKKNSQSAARSIRLAINACDGIVALLGTDRDAETAIGVGYGVALKKPIVIWRQSGTREAPYSPPAPLPEDFVLIAGGALVRTEKDVLLATQRIFASNISGRPDLKANSK